MKNILISALLMIIHFSGFAQAIPGDMINFYPFSGNANDESGNGHDGYVNGAQLTRDRCNIDNSAYKFDGISDFINIGDISDYDGSQALTISAWIFTDGILDEYSGTIISKYSTSGESERVFILDVNRYNSNAIRFAMYGADGGADWEQAITDSPIPLSRWNHVVVTWDGILHKIDFYINGIKVNASFSQNGIPPTKIYNKLSGLMIGAVEEGYSSPDYLFSGSIDEVLTYTRVLTHEEILNLYYYNCDHQELLAYYPFNGNANEELGSGNDGVTFGPVLTTDRCGNENSAYLFDGIDDYIELDHSYVTPYSKGTFAAWVNLSSLNTVQYLGCIGDYDTQDHYISLIRFDPDYGCFSIFRRHPGYADIIMGSTIIKSDEWYFVVLTTDGNQWNLYVNGIKENLSVIIGENDGDWASDIEGVDNWLLGGTKLPEPYIHNFLNGKLDDVRVYNYPLTQEEISELYYYDCEITNPVAIYSFSGNSNDESSNGYHGINHGAVLTTDRCNVQNSAYYFDGYSSYIQLPSSAAINSDKDFSISAWFCNYSITTDGKYTDNAIFGQTDGIYSSDLPIILIHIEHDNMVRGAVRGTYYPSLEVRTDEPIQNNNWYHVVLVRNASKDSLALYINGELVEKNSDLLVGNTSTNDFVSIGAYFDDLQTIFHYFHGKIDDVMIFDRSLTNKEVRDLYNYNCSVALLSGEPVVCQGDENVIYEVESDAEITEYSWDYSGDGVTINGNTNPVILSFSKTATSGILSVTVNGDKINSSDSLSVIVNPLPEGAGIISGESEVCLDQQNVIYSVPEIGNSSEYQWDFSESGVSIAGNSNVINIDFGHNFTSGVLSVHGINTCGKGASSDLTIVMKACEDTMDHPNGLLNIPNSFSPNGDGVNDVFYIKGLPGNSTLIIFDRNGKRLYESDNYNNNWYGYDSQGHQLDSGTYWYIITMPGFPQSFKGFLYLKR